MKYYFALLFVILVLGCVGSQVPSTSGKVIVKGDNISVEYTGTFENDTIFDSSLSLQFTVGAGQMIKGFDAAVIGMHDSEEKNVTIKPDEAYGNYSLDNIMIFPISSVPNGTKAGDVLYGDGQPVRVLEVRNDTVFIDVNHPLAGKTLVFKIRIVKIN